MFDQLLVGRREVFFPSVVYMLVGQRPKIPNRLEQLVPESLSEDVYFVPVANLNFICSIGIQNEPNGILVVL